MSILVGELDITEIPWEGLLRDYISLFKNNCVPFPNLHSMLEELRSNNLILGIITNGIRPFQMII
ncbi:HAD hydrolase-like protein [Peribacillus tepidiphilus]|uniref:HAD hydrolase-like protein n=1 Tax=Peribacillus tepidiphilus TaxID=2652445 RepID=UPI0030B818C9